MESSGTESLIPEPPLVVLANCFLIAFAADAGISLLHDLLRGVGVPPGLAELRTLVAVSVLVASPIYFVWLALSPRLPKSVFLPPVLFCGWWVFGGFPVSLCIRERDVTNLRLLVDVAPEFEAVAHSANG